MFGGIPTSFPGGNSEWVPPDPFSNSEVKTLSADGSVGSPHVRVGHRQDLFMKSRIPKGCGFFYGTYKTNKRHFSPREPRNLLQMGARCPEDSGSLPVFPPMPVFRPADTFGNGSCVALAPASLQSYRSRFWSQHGSSRNPAYSQTLPMPSPSLSSWIPLQATTTTGIIIGIQKHSSKEVERYIFQPPYPC